MRDYELHLHADRMQWFAEQIEEAQARCDHDFRWMRDLYDDPSNKEKCVVCDLTRERPANLGAG